MKKYVKSDTKGKNLKVIQLSFDIVTDGTVDSDTIRRAIANYIDVKGSEDNGFRCAGSDHVDELTYLYTKEYPDMMYVNH